VIYEPVALDAPVRQGDIWSHIPRVDLSLATVPCRTPDGAERAAPWREFRVYPEGIEALVHVQPVWAIVGTQNCDCLRSAFVTLFEIVPLPSINAGFGDADTAKNPTRAFVNAYTREIQRNAKWLYLPPDPAMGLSQKSAVDFAQSLRVPRTDLEALRGLRMGRLNDEAEEHFRERLANFFRRYAFDEWYPLDRDEYEEYCGKNEEGPELRPWQLPAEASSPDIQPGR